uniref:Uncharacterized protein n=1 Tax=Cyprinodon variegatus TaxID=28743 RepID=A0A3Q2D732_CYPVA
MHQPVASATRPSLQMDVGTCVLTARPSSALAKPPWSSCQNTVMGGLYCRDTFLSKGQESVYVVIKLLYQNRLRKNVPIGLSHKNSIKH